MATIAQWGIINIDERELTGLRLKYGLRLPKLQTRYLDPIIQYAGREVTRIYLDFMTSDSGKINQINLDRYALSTSIRAVTIGGVSYGNFYLVSTDINWEKMNFLQTDDYASKVANSELTTARISLEGVQ
jgi:hypothetical protein